MGCAIEAAFFKRRGVPVKQVMFCMIDSELYSSKVKALGLPTPFADGRSIDAKRYRVSQSQSKPEMAKAMIARGPATDINARHRCQPVRFYQLPGNWYGAAPPQRAARLRISQLANLPLTIRQSNRTTRIFKNGLAAAGFHHTATTLINPAHRHTVGQPLGLRQIMRHHQNRIPPL